MFSDELEELIKNTDSSKSKNNGCLGYEINTPNGRDFGCEYESSISCEDCKYGGHGGRKDPAAKCNEL